MIIFTRIIASFLIAFLFSFGVLYGQADTLKAMLPPQPIQHVAAFDVIIKLDGEIVYGLVKEVGLQLITYQRTDIPDGPIYTMLRSEVHAISYRNQVKEYFQPLNEYPVATVPVLPPVINYNHGLLFEQGVLRLSLGVIKSYTRVDDSKTYSSSSPFPAVNIGYDVKFRNQVRLGLQIGFGSRKFSNQNYSSYDSVQSNLTLKENIFGLYLYGKYDFMQNDSRLKPYFIGGLGINSSRIRSENTINFTTNNSQTLLVKSGTHSVGLGIIARVGAEYYLTDQFQVVLDAGAGISAINIGLAITLQ